MSAVACAASFAATAAAQPDLGTVAIAPRDQALTFARTDSPDGPRALAVTRYADGEVEGVDLTALLGRPVSDPIAALEQAGWDGLRARIDGAPASATARAPAATLLAPVDLGVHHVAVGTNYPEHAGEASVEEGPFLFAKLVAPTGPRAPVAAGEALLDYEVELAFVPLQPLRAGDRPATMGLILCNDYTDRALLLRHVDVRTPTSGKGFTTGKSLPGYLPVGDLFVVPRDLRAFATGLELRLWVNGAPRQQARVAEQIWDLDRTLAETWARRDVTWEHRGGRVSLLAPDGTIPARALIMSGTPGGTVFQGVGWGTRLRGAWSWLRGGGSMPVAAQVIETYIEEARAARRYLQPGDRVTIRVDRLGVIDNAIVP